MCVVIARCCCSEQHEIWLQLLCNSVMGTLLLYIVPAQQGLECFVQVLVLRSEDLRGLCERLITSLQMRVELLNIGKKFIELLERESVSSSFEELFAVKLSCRIHSRAARDIRPM